VLHHSSGKELAPELQEKERKRLRELNADDIRHCRMPQLGLKRSKDDCEKLGLRKRRNHDARRTMISIARAGGAQKDLLEWVTHGPPGDVIDGYTTLPWETLCAQVLCVKVERLARKLLAFAKVGEGGVQGKAQVLLSARAEEENLVGRTGFGNVCMSCGLMPSMPLKLGSPTARRAPGCRPFRRTSATIGRRVPQRAHAPRRERRRSPACSTAPAATGSAGVTLGRSGALSKAYWS
jgi:hypothetical protein